MRNRKRGKAPGRGTQDKLTATSDSEVEAPDDDVPLELTQEQIRQDIVPVFEMLIRWDRERGRGQ